MVVAWKPELPLDLLRLKQEILRWQGGVRYGGAEVTVVGTVEDADPAGPAESQMRLRALGTNQRFYLRIRASDPASFHLRPGANCRVWGRVLKFGEGKDEAIWLQFERAELLDHPG